MDEDSRASQLRQLYAESSKHSQYQVLPRLLRDRLGDIGAEVHSRYEHERLRFVRERLDIAGRTVIDIGGNTGFFAFELLDMGATGVDLYEGNAAHARFVDHAAEMVGAADRLRVHPTYYDFRGGRLDRVYDVGLLLNVLHHVGDDFGDSEISIEAARESIVANLNGLSSTVRTLVLQLGFCWKGNRDLALFPGGTKTEQLDFVRTRTAGFWGLGAVGIAEKEGASVIYRDPTAENLVRRDELGEFLNRPLFILHSLRV